MTQFKYTRGRGAGIRHHSGITAASTAPARAARAPEQRRQRVEPPLRRRGPIRPPTGWRASRAPGRRCASCGSHGASRRSRRGAPGLEAAAREGKPYVSPGAASASVPCSASRRRRRRIRCAGRARRRRWRRSWRPWFETIARTWRNRWNKHSRRTAPARTWPPQQRRPNQRPASAPRRQSDAAAACRVEGCAAGEAKVSRNPRRALSRIDSRRRLVSRPLGFL
ncbi:hypothetical protein M885DRAFT_324630 [Pelagophyceae sp. CCMP2097]|nr:hypothetical protein M885DRAFT_324630 [Pelagophyceae sp. CCMP2097]